MNLCTFVVKMLLVACMRFCRQIHQCARIRASLTATNVLSQDSCDLGPSVKLLLWHWAEWKPTKVETGTAWTARSMKKQRAPVRCNKPKPHRTELRVPLLLQHLPRTLASSCRHQLRTHNGNLPPYKDNPEPNHEEQVVQQLHALGARVHASTSLLRPPWRHRSPQAGLPLPWSSLPPWPQLQKCDFGSRSWTPGPTTFF